MLCQSLRRQLLGASRTGAFRNALSSSETGFCRAFAAQGGQGSVVNVQSDAEYAEILAKARDDDSLAVIDFTAKWCGPCKAFTPLFEKVSAMHPEVKFLKVDIDSEGVQKTSAEHGITAIPTIIMMKHGKRVAKVQGPDVGTMVDAIIQYK